MNSPEGGVILKHLSSNLGFNASGFGIVENPEKAAEGAVCISSKSSSKLFQLSRSIGEKCNWTVRSVTYDVAFLKSSNYPWTFTASGFILSQRTYESGRPTRILGVPFGALFKICTGSESGVLDHKAVCNEPPDAAASSRVS
eukprot:jgi/Tetstr1/428550/TSEL_018544.t1